MALTRKDILDSADQCVNGGRDHNYGSPEDNFGTVASYWNSYLEARSRSNNWTVWLGPKDVAAMLALLKLARIASGQNKIDNWVDLAGYAACGGEIEDKMVVHEPEPAEEEHVPDLIDPELY